MKNAAFILLMIILVLQSGGMLIILNVQQVLVHDKMSEKLRDRETVFEKLLITEKEYERGRINRDEIIYEGKMYDIKSSKAIGGIIELVVIADMEEENIFKRIKDLLGGIGKPGAESSNEVNNLMSLIYISNFSEDLQLFSSCPAKLFKHKNAGIITASLEILSPPPKQV